MTYIHTYIHKYTHTLCVCERESEYMCMPTHTYLRIYIHAQRYTHIRIESAQTHTHTHTHTKRHRSGWKLTARIWYAFAKSRCLCIWQAEVGEGHLLGITEGLRLTTVTGARLLTALLGLDRLQMLQAMVEVFLFQEKTTQYNIINLLQMQQINIVQMQQGSLVRTIFGLGSALII